MGHIEIADLQQHVAIAYSGLVGRAASDHVGEEVPALQVGRHKDAAQAIVKEGLKGGIPGDLNALGLLSSGDGKYLPVVRDYVRKKAKDSEGLDIMGEKGIGS